MKLYTLHREILLPGSLEEIFTFYADARNLDTITPPWLNFKILNISEIIMRQGTQIDYSLRLHRIPFRWQAEITRWDPPILFVDVQRRGPYRRWIHEHRFAERGGKILITDQVNYAVPGGDFIHWLFIEREIGKIFDYRAEKLRALFPAD